MTKTRVSCAIGALLALGMPPAAPAAVAPTSVAPTVQVNPRAPDQNVEDFKSPSVAIDPGNPNRIVIATRHDSPDYGCQIQYSTDGGASWAASSFPPPPKGTCWSPGAAWDAAGNVYVAAQNRPPRGGRQDIIVWGSSDGGQTFRAPVVIPGSDGFQAGIAVDTHAGSPHRGRIYVTWYNFPLFPVSIDTFMSFSDDGGATWSTPTSRPVPGQYQTFPQPAVAPDGTVYVVFKDTNSNAFTTPPGVEPEGCLGVNGAGNAANGAVCEIRVLRSSNGGASFDADPFTVATANFNDLSVGEQPGIAISPDGTILVTYSSIPTPPAAGCASDQDVFVARSTNRGETWSPPRRLNDDPCAGGATQRNPWISVAPNGRVDAIFYDNRDDTSEPRALYGVRYANSTDGGQTFGPNLRVNDVNFDTTTFFEPQSAGFQSNEFDQVNGIASTNARAVGAWGDTRNASDPSSSTVSDVYSVRIGFDSLAGPGPGPRPGGGPSPGLPAFGGCAALTANVIQGTTAANKINGTPRADRIFAGTGDDVVDALAGTDCVDLGTGDDRGQGGLGDDLVVGGLGADRISGSSGEDRLRGNGGKDRIDVGRGNDRAFGDAGNDVIRGSFGNDRLHGVSGNDRLGGSRGRDRINGGSGRDLISGGSSNDVVRGDRGNDRVNGNSGNDRLFGNSGKDQIIASTGRDVVRAGAGNDRVDVRDGQRDRVNCGRGRDSVIADPEDKLADNCERKRRKRA